MIYIASPYSHPDPLVKIERYKQVLRYTTNLKLQGVVCFSPICYGHQFHMLSSLPENYQFWQDFNEHMLMTSTELRLYLLDGWRESAGMEAERRFAERNGIPVKMVMP